MATTPTTTGDVESYEKLGEFYLGRRYDPATSQTQPEPLLYDSRDLLTHALCVGMTGSGKTGLCVDLLEEAAIDRIPSLVIDPKGDLGNLLLTFPDLRPAVAAQRGRGYRGGLSGHSQAAPRTPLESPCTGGRSFVSTRSEKT